MRKPFYVWDEKLSVGVHVLDEDHKVLINLINELHEGITEGHGTERLGTVLDKLIDYVKEHLTREEELMDKASYPYYDDHLATHAVFAERFTELQKRYNKGQFEALSTEALEFLKEWLNSHILVTDKKYQKYLNASGIR